MGDSKRKLVIEILGDAKDASKALMSVGKDTDKTAANLQKFGGIAVAAGTALAGGLMFAARESENAEKESRKLDNSIKNSTKTFERNGDALRDLAGDIQAKTAADADDIVGMQSRLVQFGLEENQVRSLTPLIVDLSRKMGVDMDSAAKYVTKALDGSSGGLSRLGIKIDAAKLKADPFNTTMETLRATVGGYAEEEGATFSGQLERLKNQFGDLVEGVGGGAISMISGFTDKVSGAATAVSKMNPELADTAGKVGAVTAGALVLVGSLSMAVGKAMEMRDRFTQVGVDGERSLNKVGKAAAAIGAVGAAFALWQMSKALNQSTQNALGFETAMNKTTAAVETGKKVTARNLADMASASEGLVDKMSDAWNIIGGTGSRKTFELDGEVIQIDNMTRALENLKSQGRIKELSAAIDELGNAKWTGKNWDTARHQFDAFQDKLKGYKTYIKSAKDANDATATSTGLLTDEVDEQGDAVEEATSEWDNYAKAISASADPIFGAIRATQDLTDAKAKVWAAQVEVNKLEAAGKKGTEEYATAVKNLAAANSGQVSAAFSAEGALAKLKAGVENGTVSYKTFNSTLDAFVTAGQISAQQADLTRWSVGLVRNDVDGLNGRRALVHVDADTEQAKAKLRQIGDQLRASNLNFVASVYGWSARAKGGPVDAGQPYLVGEQGPELVIPRTSGTVIPADRTAAIRSATGRGVVASAAAPVTVDLRGAVVTNDMAKTILDLVESAVAAGHRPTRLAAVLR